MSALILYCATCMQHVACTAQAASDLIDMVVPVSHLTVRCHLDAGYVWHKAAFSTGMTKYRVDRILLARTRDRSRNGRVDRGTMIMTCYSLPQTTDRSSACVAALTSRTFHCRDGRDNADIRAGRRRRLFKLLRRPLLVDN